MITLVTGVPGSGKSYFAVYALDKFKDKTKILHNVDGLKIGTRIDDYCVEKNLNMLDLFSNNFHENHKEFRGYLFVIDECQTLFPKNFKNPDIEKFFQLHRHYGIDIILLSQDYKYVSPYVTLLAEFQYRAVSDTANPLPFMFLYKQMIGYEQIGSKRLMKKQKVFDLYKTADFDQKETRKKARPMMYIIVVCLVLGVFGVYKILGLKETEMGHEKTEETGKAGIPPPTSHTPQKQQPQRFSQQQNQYPTQSGNYEDYTQYPTTLKKELGGVVMPISTFADSTGHYALLLGVAFEFDMYPYPIYKTRFGYAALVPVDVFEYEKNYKTELVALNAIDPNILPQENKMVSLQ